MYCSKCGAQNGDGGDHCVICGTVLVAPPAEQPEPAAAGPVQVTPPSSADAGSTPHVESYLVWAILTTLFCCIPAGVVSIVYASQVSSRLAANDIEGALKASKNAKTWAWVAGGVGLGIGLLWILALIATAING